MDLYIFDNLAQKSGVRHAVSARNTGEPAQFSMAYHTGENLLHIEHNRRLLQEYFGEETRFVSALQVHGDKIYEASSHESRGWKSLDETLRVDAMITNVPNVALTILTADCVPILLYDPIRQAVGAVHAGWQGSRLNIATKTVRKMEESYGSDPADILVGIGPSIRGCCYEVGTDVAEHFISYSGTVEDKKDGKYLLDLKLVNSLQLRDAGVLERNIEISPYCTSCDNDKFFSYRKEGGTKGRFVSAISLSA